MSCNGPHERERSSMELLLDSIRKFRDERDWRRFHTPKDVAIALSIEAAELLELFQWSGPSGALDDKLLEHARGEIADIFTYLVYFCDAAGIDLSSATFAKLRRNEARFPSGSPDAPNPVFKKQRIAG
jgi:NTP pyrophosphatase (non-canonical NTP hydrolase)